MRVPLVVVSGSNGGCLCASHSQKAYWEGHCDTDKSATTLVAGRFNTG